MPRAVYSTRFLELPIGSTDTLVYTVPSGFVAVVVDINARLTSGTGQVLVVDVVSPAMALAVVTASTSDTGVAHWSGRQVLNEGEQLRCYNAGTGSGSIMVSGYLLAL